MRRAITMRVLLLAGACAGTGALWVGCTPGKQTELVPGMSTQVRVPRDLRSIRVDVLSGGINQFCGVYDVLNGVTHLPRTLGVQKRIDAPVTVVVTGFTVAPNDQSIDQDLRNALDPNGCSLYPIPTMQSHPGVIRVVRAAKTQYVQDHVKFIPIPLRFPCFDTQCDGDTAGTATCKAGQCTVPDIDPAILLDYNDAYIFGDSSSCFSPALCLTDAVTPVEIDATTCKFALVGTADAPKSPPGYPFTTNGNGLNVRAFYDDGSVSEVLDLDKDEGYFVPDPAKPQTFQLAPGLCKLLHPAPGAPPPAHRISALVASGMCPSKTPFQPLCEEQSPSNPDSDASVSPTSATDSQNVGCFTEEVKPSPSALVILLDDTKDMTPFYGPSGTQTVLNLSLQDPVFENTVVSLEFFPHAAAACPTPGSLDNPFKFARDTQKDIAGVLTNKSLLDGPQRFLDLAAQDAYTQLAGLKGKFNRRGILVLSNGSFGGDCGGSNPKALEDLVRAQATGANPISTYTILLGSAKVDAAGNSIPNPTGLDEANTIASLGGTLHTFNADKATGGQPSNGFDALAQVTSDLASCVYELPGNVCNFSGGQLSCSGTKGLSGTGDISYFNPIPPGTTVRIPYNAGCGVTPDAHGWSRTTDDRIRVCGADCSALQDVLKNTATLAGALQTPPPAIPIYVTNCAGKPQTPVTDAGLPDATVSDAGADTGATPDGASDATADAHVDAGADASDAATD